jgi:acetylornithine deacetylase
MIQEQAVLEALAGLENEALAFLRRLVATPSITGNEERAQLVMADQMRRMGLDVESWVPQGKDLEGHPGFSMVSLGPPRPVVVGRVKGSPGGPSLALNGHIDVVPEGNRSSWEEDPWSGLYRDGRVFGRGACDMKGGLTAALFAVAGLLRAGVRPRGDVLVQSVTGEEDGGIGTLACISRGLAGDAAVVMEPTRLAVCPAQGGALTFRLIVKGKAAHACVRDEGVSAVEMFFHILQAVRAYEARRNVELCHPLYVNSTNKVPIEFGTVRSGDWNSTVPDELVAEGRAGVFPGENAGKARQDFERMLDGTVAQHPWLRENPPRVEWLGGQWEPAETPADHTLVSQLKGAFETVMGRRPIIEGVTYGSDMRLFTNYAGIPAVLFGPGDVRLAHFANESVPFSEVMAVARTLAVTLVRWGGEQSS